MGRNRHGIAVDQGHRGGDSMRAARECQQQERAGKIEASVTFHARENASSFFNAASTLTLWEFFGFRILLEPLCYLFQAEGADFSKAGLPCGPAIDIKVPYAGLYVDFHGARPRVRSPGLPLD